MRLNPAATFDDLGIPDMPASEHMLRVFLRMGPIGNSGMGPVPRDWVDVQAFSRMTGLAREAWEREVLFDMSAAYLVERLAATNPARIAPTNPPELEDDENG